jgi:hypothetical protein
VQVIDKFDQFRHIVGKALGVVAHLLFQQIVVDLIG